MRQDILHALRGFRRTPGFTIAVLLVLAIGIGANTAIFSVVNAVLFRPLPFQEPERLAMAWERFPNFGPNNTGVSYADFFDFRRENRVFDEIAAFLVGN